MKVCKKSLLLALLFIGIFTFQSVNSGVLLENSQTHQKEYQVDERIMKVSVDDFFLSHVALTFFNSSVESLNVIYTKTIYAFNLKLKPFRPPIFV